MESELGDVKPLITEQTALKLPDGHYIADGSSNVYNIKDFSGNETGYSVEANKGIRCCGENTPMIIKGGIPISDVWGEGGKVSFKDVGWNGSVEPLTPTITPDMIFNNSIPKEIIDANPPLIRVDESGKGKFTIGNKMYLFDSLGKMEDLGYEFKLGTEYIDNLLLGVEKKYPNSLQYLKDNAKLGTQYMSVYTTIYFVGKDGQLKVYNLK